MAGFLKKMFSFGKKEVTEKPAEDEPLAPINWNALSELRRDDEQSAADTSLPESSSAETGTLPESPGPTTPEFIEPASAKTAPVEIVQAEPTEIAPAEIALPETAKAEISLPQLAPDVSVSPEPASLEAQTPEMAARTIDQPAPAPSIDLRQIDAASVEFTPVEPAPVEIATPGLVAAETATTEPVSSETASRDVAAAEAPVPFEPEPLPELQPGAVARPADIAATDQPVTEIASAPLDAPASGVTETPVAGTEAPQLVDTAYVPPASQPETAMSPPFGQPLAYAPIGDKLATAAPVETAKPAAALTSAVAQPSPVSPQRPDAGKVTVAKKVEQKAQPAPVEQPVAKLSWFQRMRQGLARSSRELGNNIAGVFTKRKLDEDTLQDLEDVLIRADLGVETALRITDSLASGRYGKNVSDDEVRAVMAEEIGKVLSPVAQALELDLSHKPHVILVVGVNGTGKTTTIGKLAAKLTEGGLSVMLAAGDTFRAAAIEQLKIWGERTRSPVISSKLGADAAGLAYDAFEQAKGAGSDVLIIDTAGRLQNKAELMAELEKIVRVLGKLDPDAPHTVLQTIDATTGQNALNQVEIFRNIAGVNGLVMTKLDGTARGGILVGIAAKYKLPVYFIGVGEQVDDLEPFSATEFARAISGMA